MICNHGDGYGHIPGRRASNIFEHRLAGADPARLASPAARLGARRRVWRSGNLCRGACARAHERGYATSWIQTTATLGLLLALILIALCRGNMAAKDFAEWGWRIPFLISVILLVFSVYIRLKLNETPIFQKRCRKEKARRLR